MNPYLYSMVFVSVSDTRLLWQKRLRPQFKDLYYVDNSIENNQAKQCMPLALSFSLLCAFPRSWVSGHHFLVGHSAPNSIIKVSICLPSLFSHVFCSIILPSIHRYFPCCVVTVIDKANKKDWVVECAPDMYIIDAFLDKGIDGKFLSSVFSNVLRSISLLSIHRCYFFCSSLQLQSW